MAETGGAVHGNGDMLQGAVVQNTKNGDVDVVHEKRKEVNSEAGKCKEVVHRRAGEISTVDSTSESPVYLKT